MYRYIHVHVCTCTYFLYNEVKFCLAQSRKYKDKMKRSTKIKKLGLNYDCCYMHMESTNLCC